MWNVRFTPEAERWYASLSPDARASMRGAIQLLEAEGPRLGRPAVDRVHGSRFHNMKELRSFSGNRRALFAFDPNQEAIVLVGGDKTNNWKGFYRKAIPFADRLYERHLREIGKGEACRARAGARSTARTR